MTGITSLDTVSQNQSNLSSRATAPDVTDEPMRSPTPSDLAVNQLLTGCPTAVLPPVT
ncbi:hypothetical protein [Streptomyces sp. NPDC002104]